jgi:hypothetical protein
MEIAITWISMKIPYYFQQDSYRIAIVRVLKKFSSLLTRLPEFYAYTQ